MCHTSFTLDEYIAFLILHPYLKNIKYSKKLKDKEEGRYVKEIEQHAN